MSDDVAPRAVTWALKIGVATRCAAWRTVSGMIFAARSESLNLTTLKPWYMARAGSRCLARAAAVLPRLMVKALATASFPVTPGCMAAWVFGKLAGGSWVLRHFDGCGAVRVCGGADAVAGAAAAAVVSVLCRRGPVTR